MNILVIMRDLFFILLFAVSLFSETLLSQTTYYPSNIALTNLPGLNANVTKVDSFPFWVDNTHKMPNLKNGRLWAGELAGIDLQGKVPKVCLDDFRYGHKFENTLGVDGIGYLSLVYWLPSNGNYLLFYYILENGTDYYREFLVTTSLSGVYIGHLLVRDGWNENPNINFTQAKLNPDFTLDLCEIRNLSTTYVPYSSLSSFIGQKATYQYSINTSGQFVLNSTVLGTQRTYNVSELKGLISSIP